MARDARAAGSAHFRRDGAISMGTLGCRQPRAARSSPLSSARRADVLQKFEYEVPFGDGLIAFGDRLIALADGLCVLPALFGQRGFVPRHGGLSADFSDHGRYARERPPASAGRRPRVQGWRRFLTLGGHWRGFVLTSLAYAAQAPIREHHRPIPEVVPAGEIESNHRHLICSPVGADEQRQRTRETRGLRGLHAGLQRMDRRLPRVQHCCGPTSRKSRRCHLVRFSGVSRERRSAKAMRHPARRSNPHALPA